MRLPPRNALVFRVVAIAWLAGWFWKVDLFGPYLLRETTAFPLRDDGFPSPLQHPAVSSALWLCPALAIAAVVAPRAPRVRAASVLMAAAAFVLSLHLDTCSDATFTTSLWVGLWLVWFSGNAHRTDGDFVLRARALAQCVVGLLFLGPFVGKLTSEYTSGEAFYRLYFEGREEWPYPALRAALAPGALRELATWFSRAAIAVEGILALSPLVPFRFAVVFGCATLAAMVLASTFYLVSVLGCIAGLLVAAALLREDDGAEGGAPLAPRGAP